MNRTRISIHTGLMTVILSVLLSVSGIMCLSDAYSLGADFWSILAVCTGLSVLFALCTLPRRSWPFSMAAALGFLAVLFWKRAELQENISYLIYHVTYEFSQCYDHVMVAGTGAGSAQWLLWVLAVPLTWTTVWVCSREGSVLLAVLVYAPIFAMSLMIIDIAPVFWLILLTGGMLLLIMSQHVRERSTEEGSRLVWWLVLPTIIVISAITVLWPPADYVKPAWAEKPPTWSEGKETIQTVFEETVMETPAWNRELKSVDLSREGPKLMTGTPMLDYCASTRISYLRGASLAVYGRNAWKALDQKVYAAQNFRQTPLLTHAETTAALQVKVRRAEPLFYTAYDLAVMPETGRAVDDAYIQNPDKLLEYTVRYGEGGTAALPEGYDAFVQQVYLQIPKEMQEPLLAIAREAGLEGSSAETVAEYVRRSGQYDLMTPKVPRGKDFVLYFLQESHQGYCVHFASATVMLLRTVGIPARYVTGYAVKGEPNQWQTVTQNDAHAWVEYYVPSVGWQRLDPTPASEEPEEQTGLPEPPEETRPEPEQLPEVPEPKPDNPTQPEKVPAKPEGTEPLPTKTWNRNLLWLLVVPELLAVVWLRRWLLCRRRLERCTRAKPNRRALTYWHWLVQLCRLRSQVPEEELLCLAEKAKYSQHTLTEEEIDSLKAAVDSRIDGLKKEPFWKRLWYRYGRVLY